MSVKVYQDEDADLLDLQNKVCAVVGFGSQGHAHALNLRDSGIEVIVGLYPDSKSIPIAREHGLCVLDVTEAAQRADVIFFATRVPFRQTWPSSSMSSVGNRESHRTGLTNRKSSSTADGIISGAVPSCSHSSRAKAENIHV